MSKQELIAKELAGWKNYTGTRKDTTGLIGKKVRFTSSDEPFFKEGEVAEIVGLPREDDGVYVAFDTPREGISDQYVTAVGLGEECELVTE